MSWNLLPQELQLQIIDHLERDDHKNLRLTSSRNAVSTAPKLFQTIHVTPNTRSFDRARGIVSSQQLAQHVKALVYHVGVLEDVHSGFQTFRDDIMRLHHPSGSVEEITKDILWKYHCFLEELDGQWDFEIRDEFDELNFVCQRVNALESLTVILDEDDPFEPPRDFIGRRTGTQSACSADGPHFSNLITAAAGKKLNSIRSWCTSWRCLARLGGDVLDSINTENMDDFALGLFNSEILDMESGDDKEMALEGLDTLLRRSISSKSYTLQLDFDEIPFENRSDELQVISAVVFQHQWPNLRSLALQGIAASEDDIVDFLQKHSSTLTKLHLDDVEILEKSQYGLDGSLLSHPGSIVSLFRRIGEVLNLTSATITGNFTNRDDESWYVDVECEDESCLRRDIELWLVRKSPPPFPSELLQRDTKDVADETEENSESHDTKQTRSLRSLLAEEYSDRSWVWDLDLMT